MNHHSHYYVNRPAVICTRSPWRDWTFRIAGVLLVLGVITLGAWLDRPADTELPSVAYARGVAEGRAQMLAAHAERSRVAYQAGHDEAYLRCSSAGARK
ncbi:MAG: hypothetical protein RL375_2615 [Pseudomonadota bacterium]|jgi:hypothetical protein